MRETLVLHLNCEGSQYNVLASGKSNLESEMAGLGTSFPSPHIEYQHHYLSEPKRR